MGKRKKREDKRGFGALFAYEDRKNRLSEKTTPLDRLKAGVDFEAFRPVLEKRVPRKDRSRGGRKPFDHVLMFKIMVLQTYYGLSDEQTEFDILDRMSYQRFLELNIEDDVPDRTSIWLFKEKLGEQGAKELFDCFDTALEEAGMLATKGKVVDASFVDAPRQRNTREENKDIKEGKGAPEDWSKNKRAQKDVDARWTKKNQQTHFGYKNHIKINTKTKLVEKYHVSAAHMHDSQAIDELIEDEDGSWHADSAYQSEETREKLKDKKIRNHIHEKGCRHRALTEKQKAKNTLRSKVRARVEHVFGFMTQSMNADRIRSIGIKRARRGIGLSNLVYNMARCVQLQNHYAQ